MAMSPQDMDGFMTLLSTKDTKEKLNVATNLVNYLDDPINSIECADIGLFIDSLIPWMQNSNNKVSQCGIDAMTLLVDRMAYDFRPYVGTVLPPIIDRLGDSKEMVRDKAQRLLLKLMEREVITPQSLFEKMSSTFTHKNNKIREEVLSCLQRTLIEHGASSLSLSKLTPAIVKMMGDPIPTVRDAAFNTLVEMYRHVGDRLRADLQKKQLVPVSKLSALIAKFDEMKAGGDLLPSAHATDTLSRLDDPDGSIKVNSAYKSRVSSVSRKPLFAATPRSSTNSMAAGQVGAVDEEAFQRAFEEVPQVQLFSHRELEEQMSQIRNIISDSSKDWDKRVEALKRVRSLMIAGASSFDEFPKLLRSLETPFETSLKDLRSQVVREACISVAYISQLLGMKCDHFAEMLLQHLINLIMNSAKVMASAGEVAIRFIIRHTHYPRLIPFITQNMSSKSKDIRRASCSFLEQLLQTWSTHSLERHIAILQDAIKKGIEDADPEARQTARKAYKNFRNHFPEQADSLLNSLDPAHKRVLSGELSLSSSSSSNSLHQQGRVGTGTIPKTRTECLSARRNSTSSAPVALRSNSAIDLQAAQRAKARAQYAALARQKVGSGASLRDDYTARPKKNVQDMVTSANTSPERMGRTRNRVSGVSQSQPNSRSGSPSSRLNYSTYTAARRLPFNGGRSTGTSRETSPSRGYTLSKLRGGTTTGRVSAAPPLLPSTARPVLAQRILQQSLEAESALANALTFDSMDSVDLNRSLTGNRKYRLGDDHSDDSETSSVCSERSDSFKRPCDNISEIIFNCASTHWSDRKEGLVGLQSYFTNGNILTGSELKTITDIFTKMFMDSHTKVFSLFLDALNELIVTHKEDLHDWLYILLTRLLNKLGGDLLGSIQNKIHKSLAFVRESFPQHLQMNTVMRFLVDPTQTPNTKVKVALLTFITQLAAMSEPSAIANNATTSKALAKIISWTNDTKSSELRRASQAAVVALYNLSLPQITMMLSTLPSEYQEAAAALVRRSSTANNSSPPSPSVTGCGNNTNGGLGSPRLIHSPGTPHRLPPSSNTTIDDEHLNPEEVYRSLRRTTAEIQNYSFKALDRDTTSQDSGISQMSAGPTDRLDILEERQEDHTSNTNTNTSETSLADISYIASRLMEFNGTTKSPVGVIDFDSIDFAKDPAVEENIVQEALDVLKNPDSVTDEILLCLAALGKIAHERSTTLLRENFRVLLKILLELLERPEYKVRIWVLEVLLQMFKRRTLDQCFIGYTELLVVKVLESSCHDYKYMARFAEACLVVMARVLPAAQVIQVVNPHILTADTPIKQLAIKMLNAVVDVNPPEVIQPHLSGIMTSLLKAYDNDDSSVRKCAVFCIVALHKQLDQAALAPYLVSLPGSKIKLLDVYIRRMRSAPTSPKNNATPA